MKKISYDIQAQQNQYGLRNCLTSTIHSATDNNLIKFAMENSNENDLFKLWDKAQVIFGFRRTRIGRNTIFVGDKNSTIDALTSLIQLKNKWTDRMDSVLQIFSVNRKSERESIFFNQEHSFTFQIRDISLPECQTGFVYFLISCRYTIFSYIGMTNFIYMRIN